jgi:hypothetical protein
MSSSSKSMASGLVPLSRVGRTGSGEALAVFWRSSAFDLALTFGVPFALEAERVELFLSEP